MKRQFFILAILCLSAGYALAEGQHAHQARHGGILVETKSLDLEVVVTPGLVQVYPNDHGKPVRLDGASGKVTLLNGADKTEVALLPAGDRLEARGAFTVAAGTKGIALVTLAGKGPVVGRFVVR